MNRNNTSLHLFNFWLLVVGLIAIGIWSMISLRQTAAIYDGVLTMEAQNSGNVASASLPNTSVKLTVPDWNLFKHNNIWGLTSKNHPLPDGFDAPELVYTAVAHGDAKDPMQIQKSLEQPLKRLVAAAKKDGFDLMISSAYRSVEDQTKLYEEFVETQGAEMAALYVAKPGTSEHHTGLSVDFSSVSKDCEQDSDDCSLSQAAAAWLFDNAHNYGFIQRYPIGKQPITGVAFEPWHYRYIGIPMAKAVAASELTYDEVVRQIAPGYSGKLRQP